MTISSGSYPHPVLGHYDDVSSTFEVVNFFVSPGIEDVEVKFRYKTDDPDLDALIQAGDAILMAWWDCTTTMAAGQLELSVLQEHADGKTYIGWLDQRLVRDRVTVTISVIADKRMPFFSWQNQHLDYGQTTFDVRRGDFLVEAGDFKFSAEKLYDPMQPPLGSCFRITPDPKIKKGMALDFSDDDQVVVRMSDEMIAGLQEISHRPDLQISLVVLPALMDTIHFIQKNESDSADEDLSGTAWYQAIKSRIDALNGAAESGLEIAQKILDHPTTKVLVNPLFTDNEE